MTNIYWPAGICLVHYNHTDKLILGAAPEKFDKLFIFKDIKSCLDHTHLSTI